MCIRDSPVPIGAFFSFPDCYRPIQNKNLTRSPPSIVTHCGGGGRGQKAKDYLLGLGYTNVVNGGGPKVIELWERFGSL